MVDKRHEKFVDRDAIITKIKEKLAVSTKLPLPAEPTKKPTIKIKAKKLKKLRLVPEGEEEKITIKRRTRQPKGIVKEFPEGMMILGSERFPKVEPEVLIRSSSYYLNNREIFVDFISSLFKSYKQKILDDEDEISCGEEERKFSLLTHQKIVRDYLNLYTPYRGLLLYHGLGSGKTCSSIAIAEGMKTSKQIIVMTPASLKMNYFEELKKCGDNIYRKNQFWEFVETKKKQDLVKALSNSLSLSIDYITRAGGAWLVNVKKPSNFETLSAIQRTGLDNQLNEMIQHKYKFINYNGLRNSHLRNLTTNFTKNPFDDAVVIIDEAHNFVGRIVNKLKRPESLSMKLYDYMMNAKNARIILLTGTPIINYPNEIGILFNMLRGKIKTWSFQLTVSRERKVSQETLKKIFDKFDILDFMEYKPSSTTLAVTRNPFGFYNFVQKGEYKGVTLGERGDLDDDAFVKIITSILSKNDIKVTPGGVRVETYKALPDSLENFQSYFIDEKNSEIKNVGLFKRRILGLTSYFRSAQEQLMPSYQKSKDFHVIDIPMSDFQFNIYEEARVQERKLEMQNAKKKKKMGEGIYEDTVSTYRIFSRAFCNYVFPHPQISRPMPHEDESIANVIKETADEDLLDAASVGERLDNPDGRFIVDDADILGEIHDKEADKTYEQRIKDAIKQLKDHEDTYLTPEALETYSPKFLHILENIQDVDHKGLHLIYSQFRTLEGIGILKLILEANGFAHFKIKKNEQGSWELNIAKEDLGKPTFALYTGTETPEEKEIIRNVFNSTWKYIPTTLAEQLKRISSNNIYGEIIKILMITSSGAEGISLRNVRYVHITEPYWHPVRIEQVIGRARRICSHTDLPKELQTVEVFLYLMKFTEKQLKSDDSIELRLKDKSKIDHSTPITSDQALYEIATLKEEISQQLLTAVKEASIDCNLHARSGKKENLKCFSFGSVSTDKFAFKPSISEEESDTVADVNKKEVKIKLRKLRLEGINYAYNLAKGELYDWTNYSENRNLVLVGRATKEGKKVKIEWFIIMI